MKNTILKISFLFTSILILGCEKENPKTKYQEDQELSRGLLSFTMNDSVEWKSEVLLVSNYNYVEDRINLTARIYTEDAPKYSLALRCINPNKKEPQNVYANREWIIIDSISKQRITDSCIASYNVWSFDVSEASYYTLDDIGNYLIIDEYNPETGAFRGSFEITFFRSKRGKPVSGYPDTLRATNGRFIVIPEK